MDPAPCQAFRLAEARPDMCSMVLAPSAPPCHGRLWTIQAWQLVQPPCMVTL